MYTLPEWDTSVEPEWGGQEAFEAMPSLSLGQFSSRLRRIHRLPPCASWRLRRGMNPSSISSRVAEGAPPWLAGAGWTAMSRGVIHGLLLQPGAALARRHGGPNGKLIEAGALRPHPPGGGPFRRPEGPVTPRGSGRGRAAAADGSDCVATAGFGVSWSSEEQRAQERIRPKCPSPRSPPGPHLGWRRDSA